MNRLGLKSKFIAALVILAPLSPSTLAQTPASRGATDSAIQFYEARANRDP